MTIKANDPLTLSVIVASSGRPTLSRTLASIAPQMRPGDELLVSVNDDAPWGHAARNKLMARAIGHGLAWCDDDDTLAEGALEAMRCALEVQPFAMHIFKMRYASGEELWREPVLLEGNVSTQMVLTPRIPERLGRWGERYAGDFDFIASTAALMGEPVWHREVVALVRPD